MWLSLLSLHLIGNVGYNLLLRKSVLAKTDKWLLATILQTGIAIPALFISTMALTILLQVLNVKALQYLEASVYSVVYNTRIILISFIGAILLSEKLTPLQIIGGLLIFSSVFVVRQKGKFTVTKLGLLYGFGAAVTLSFLNVTEKLLNQSVGFFEYFLPVSIACAMIMWVIVLMRKTKVSFPQFAKPSNILLMGFRALSAFGFSAAIIYGPVAISNYISSLIVVFTVVCGILFLNERDFLKQKIIAVIIACIGLTLILIPKF
jgi:drug/metabolite transporter (DMT)-like permease